MYSKKYVHSNWVCAWIGYEEGGNGDPQINELNYGGLTTWDSGTNKVTDNQGNGHWENYCVE